MEQYLFAKRSFFHWETKRKTKDTRTASVGGYRFTAVSPTYLRLIEDSIENWDFSYISTGELYAAVSHLTAEVLLQCLTAWKEKDSSPRMDYENINKAILEQRFRSRSLHQFTINPFLLLQYDETMKRLNFISTTKRQACLCLCVTREQRVNVVVFSIHS